MDVKSAFLYGTIKEEVYVCQPPGFEDSENPNKVYKVVKALYGLNQAPRAWYETLATYILENGFQRGTIDQTLFIKKQQKDILFVQIYVDDIIFGATNTALCQSFKKPMKDKFQMSSMGELTFFLGLQVKQKKDGIFISQDKYVAEILKKFGLSKRKSASTPIDAEKPLLKDLDGEDVDVHTYRSMIGSLMYLTSSRPDIMFAVCVYARFQATPKVSHLNAVKRIFRYLKGKPYLGLWYLKDSPFDLVAYSDSEYAGASLDKKSTTGGCQFLGCRLISWKCKKQIVVATSLTEAKYVAAASGCAQVLWIQNQLLDYGLISWQCKKQTVVATSSTEAEYVAATSGYAQVLWIQNQLLDYGVFNSPMLHFLRVEMVINSPWMLPKNWLVQKQTALDAAEGFEQIIDFLNGSYIHYALTLNPHIYISCIKQFWNTASVKRSDDVTRFQALVDKKKIVISEAVIREILQLDDAEGVVCLPNEEIFAGLAQMGYEKPSTKLTFYKAFFSSQWKFLIHTILQSLSAKRTSWNEFSTAMASVMICLSKGQKFNFSKYIFDSLVCNVDSSSKFYMYPWFIQIIIQNQVGNLSTHSTRFISPTLTQKVFANMRRVGKGFSGVETPLFKGMLAVKQLAEEGLAEEQKLEIIKLKARVKRLEKDNKVKSSKLRRLRKVGASKRVESSDDMEDAKKQAEIYHLDLDHSSKVLNVVTAASQVSAASATIFAAKPSIPTTAPTVVAAYTRRRKGVIIRDPEEELSSKTPAKTPKLKDKGKGILIETPKPMKKKGQIELDAEYARKLHEEINKDYEEINKDIDWDAIIDHSREEMKEEDQEIIKSINETPAQKAAKRRKLSKEA
uniref:Uncharacterized mitochondrial protein AtMg00810-like n=1 Tax=Tanacetum cinerariifolium TaxID=118510 RepID=A0A6L2NHZ4_TANCI|nr:uncharacterized mitochondrial protein AtMg00810-like [Tanacetum cinerariifolium]